MRKNKIDINNNIYRTTKNKDNNKGTTMITVISIVLLVFILAVGCILLIINNKKQSNANKESSISEEVKKVNVKEDKDEKNTSKLQTSDITNATIIAKKELDWLYKYNDESTAESHIADNNTQLFISPEDAGVKIDNGELFIPETVIWKGKKYTVTNVFNDCFQKNENITSVTLPNTITRIDEKAFYDCKNLKTVKLPENLIYIGDYAFAGCELLTDIYFPKSVTDIRKCAFFGCKSLKTVDLSKCSFSTMYQGVFENCTSLSLFKFPQNLDTIQGFILYGDTALKELDVPDDITFINSSAFLGLDDCTLYVSENSKAYDYAIEEGLKYKIK